MLICAKDIHRTTTIIILLLYYIYASFVSTCSYTWNNSNHWKLIISAVNVYFTLLGFICYSSKQEGSSNLQEWACCCNHAEYHRSAERPLHVVKIQNLLSHPDDMNYDNEFIITHTDEIPTSDKSSGWIKMEGHVVQVTLELERLTSTWLNKFTIAHKIPMPAKSSRWHNALAISHLDEIRSVANSSRWLRIPMPLGHPDDLCPMQYVIQITYNTTICHPDDLAKVGISSRWVMVVLYHQDDQRSHS